MKDKLTGIRSLIVAAVILFFICITVVLQSCKTEAIIEKKVERVIAPVKEEVEEVKDKIEDVVPELKEEIENKLNELSFGSAWRIMYNKYGEGHIFDWNDKCYTTNMKREGDVTWQVQ